MLKLQHLILLFLFAPAFLLAHGDRIELNMSGQIHDSYTNKPVGGALISVEKNGQMIYSTRSGDDGKFSIKFEGPIGRHDKLQIRVSKKGFQNNVFPPIDLIKENVVIELKKKSPIPILKPGGQATPMIAI